MVGVTMTLPTPENRAMPGMPGPEATTAVGSPFGRRARAWTGRLYRSARRFASSPIGFHEHHRPDEISSHRRRVTASSGWFIREASPPGRMSQ